MCATAPASAAIKLRRAVDRRQHVGGIEVGGAGKAAIEMRGHHGEAPERKVGEAGIQLHFGWRARKRRRARISSGASRSRRAKLPSTVRRGWASGSPRPTAANSSEPRASCFEVRGMGRKARNQNQRRTVAVGRDVNQGSERMAGIAVDGRQCPRPRCPQQGLGERFGLEIRLGGGAFSGSRSGMTPGRAVCALSGSAMRLLRASEGLPHELPRFCLVVSHFRLYMGI